MHTKTDAQPVEIFWENDQRPVFWLIWGPKVAQKNGPLRPIFSTHLKVLGMSMWSNTVVKPVKTFWEITKHQKFFLLWGPKWPRNWAFEAHILHISESSCKQDWCESRPNFSTKYSKTWILTHLEAQNSPKFGPLVPLFYTPTKVAPMGL